MRLSIRTLVILTGTIAVASALVFSPILFLDGAFFHEPLIGILLALTMLLLVPLGFVLTGASLFFDQPGERRTALRGAMYGGVLFVALLFIVLLLFPKIH